jgi:hypothetical protein
MMKKVFTAASTPLASIFGSGFLVIVPILASSTGRYSLPAMAGISAVAYAVGWVIRTNIARAEPQLDSGRAARSTLLFDRASDVALVPAYVISVCLYLRILSTFFLSGIGVDSLFHERLLTSAVIAFISFIGFIRGLDELQKLEGWAIWVTMGIIVVMVTGFSAHDASLAFAGGIELPRVPQRGLLTTLAVLGGTLICVQGFETSRYLREEYSNEMRIRSCRLSQIIATVVYLAFIAAATPLMHYLSGPVRDDALILLAARVAPWLPIPLVAAAVLSQFSAAVADTLGGEGNMVEASGGRISHKLAYLVIGAGAVLLAWSASTFEIVALASRAFAVYYMLQCLVAFTVSEGLFRKASALLLATILLAVAVFATPVG